MLRFLALWVLLSIAIGFWAHRRGRGALTWFLVSALVSPIIGTLLLLATQGFVNKRGTYLKRIRHSRAYRILLNILLAILVIWFLTSALNRGSMKSIRLAQPHGFDVVPIANQSSWPKGDGNPRQGLIPNSYNT